MCKSTKFHQALVLFASFLGQVISEGIMLSFTVYYPTLAQYFHATNAEISLMGSVAYTCWFVLGKCKNKIFQSCDMDANF